ncbi:hypothetical protein DOY81_007844 [Sarcophaga bullata]|nr:hypothetical protein DOY81_007844 [Sarcophaga bullata]
MCEFGEEFSKDWPLSSKPKTVTEFGEKLLKECLKIQKPPMDVLIDIEDFIQKSNEFPIKFPIDTCRVKSRPERRHGFIQKQISSAYPVIHEKVLYLIMDFLEHKRKYGTSLEKTLYETMTITEFVQRLLTKRCISFVGYHDCYLLITGQEGHGKKYLNIGTDEEKKPLTLQQVLSYDEVKISALLSVTSHTDFINDGRRHNRGNVEEDLNKIEKEGVVVGLIGARFAREERMEFEDIFITKEQNIAKKGYGFKTDNITSLYVKIWQYLFNSQNQKLLKFQDYRRIWNKFYEEEKDYLYENVRKDGQRFFDCAKGEYIFDNVLMKKRFAIPFDLLLLEANQRAQLQNKLAYIHVVGIGLGVWLAALQQEIIFMACFQQRLKHLLDKLHNVGVIHFSWFKLKDYGDEMKDEGFIESKTHANGGIQIRISNRNPHEKLPPAYSGMLPVVSYAWDGNALPGNEFWLGSLSSSSDPAAACSTLITELANPHINTAYVNGNNLHIASIEHGVLHVRDYVERILKGNEATN